jgi:hypothetical protein
VPVSASAGAERHRAKDGWQAGTVAAILQNPRYTGYAVFGRWTKHEELLDPDDAAAGNVTRFRRSPSHRIVRSKKPAHPAIISVVHPGSTAAPPARRCQQPHSREARAQ